MDRGVGDADRAHQPELGLHEQILQRVFGDRRQRTVHAERAGAMAHGMELEIAEGDLFHLAIGGMIVDPVLVAAEAVARMQHRRMLVGDAGQLVEPAAGELAEPIEMRFQLAKIICCQIKRQADRAGPGRWRRNSAPRRRARDGRRRDRRSIARGERADIASMVDLPEALFRSRAIHTPPAWDIPPRHASAENICAS